MPLEKVTPHRALEWCQNFLCGAWSTITVEQMQMERIPQVSLQINFDCICFVCKNSGGLSNYLYCCSLPDDVEVQKNEPRKVLLRYLDKYLYLSIDLF